MASPRRSTFAAAGVAGVLVLFVVGLPALALTETSPEQAIKERLGVGGGDLCLGYEPTRASPGWTPGPALPFARDEARATAIGTAVYIAGGLTDLVDYGDPGTVQGVAERVEVRSVDSFLRFDTRTGSFQELPPLPRPMNHVGIVDFGGEVYVVGGHGNLLDGAEPKSALYRFSPSSGEWSTLPSMPTARGAAGAAVIGDRLYVAGGMSAGRALRTLEIFDFGTRRWTSGADMPSGREHVAAVAVGGRLYVIGGRANATDALATVERYEPAADRWEGVAALPVPTGGEGAVVSGGAIIVLGGNDNRRRKVVGDVQRLDPATETWTQLSPMRTPRHGFAAATVGGKVYTFGGSRCGSFGVTDLTEIFDSARGGS